LHCEFPLKIVPWGITLSVFGITGKSLYVKMRIYREILVASAFVVLVIVGFEYYNFNKWTLFEQDFNRVIIVCGKSSMLLLS
jgi:hypothetical protein